MLTAIINEEECVGCSRCIPACPVDAIIGANKKSHTILLDECIGCKLCVEPCPVDCIEIKPLEEFLQPGQDINKLARAKKAKLRHQRKLARIAKTQVALLPEPTKTSKETIGSYLDKLKAGM